MPLDQLMHFKNYYSNASSLENEHNRTPSAHKRLVLLAITLQSSVLYVDVSAVSLSANTETINFIAFSFSTTFPCLLVDQSFIPGVGVLLH